MKIKKILIISGNDKWIVPKIINELRQRYLVKHYYVKSNNFKLNYFINNIIIFGIINSIKIFFNLRRNSKHSFEINKEIIEYKVSKISKKFDLIILINYPYKFNKTNLNICNFHPSLLPTYKNLNIIPRIMYDKLNKKNSQLGVTIHKISKKFDNGKILWQMKYKNQNISLDFFKIYKECYMLCVKGIDYLINKKNAKFKIIKLKKNNNETKKLNTKIALKLYLLRLRLIYGKII